MTTVACDEGRGLLLGHLAGEVPRGVVLDWLKDRDLYPWDGPRHEPYRVHVRWFIRRDIPEVLAIERSEPRPWTESRIVTQARRRETILAVAELGETVVGWMAYRLLRYRRRLSRLVVHPGHRRRGVGRAMIAWLAERSPSTYEAWAHEGDADACLFLAALGFRLERHQNGRAVAALEK